VGKLIVFSILIATIAIPLVHARRPRERRALRKTLVTFGVFCALWVFATLFIAPRL
jgi:hypothetical protein